MVTITIDERGTTLEIPDAEGELVHYGFALIDPGFSLWALRLTRLDSGSIYRVAEDTPGKWVCACPLEKYRRRGAEHCKHILAAKLLRAWLKTFLAA